MRKVVVAATQMSCTWDREATLAKAEKLGVKILTESELIELANNHS